MSETEQHAIGVVMTFLAMTDRLRGDLRYNDKTPIIDGGVFLYTGSGRKNEDLIGYVPAQVKGLGVDALPKKRDTAKYPVGREELEYLHDNGGGMYFYVPIRKSDLKSRVYFAPLTPFKAKFYLDKMKEVQQTIGIKLTLLPDDLSRLERAVEYVHTSRTQGQVGSVGVDVLDEAESITLRTLQPLNLDKPFTLALSETDFSVVVNTNSGLSLPLNAELQILPGDYISHPAGYDVSCGGVTFGDPWVRRLNESEEEIKVSEGLRIILSREEDGKPGPVRFDLKGDSGIRESERNVTFLIAALKGETLRIGKLESKQTNIDLSEDGFTRLYSHQSQIRKIIELLDAFGVDDETFNTLNCTTQEMNLLLLFHGAIICGEPLALQESKPGPFKIQVGGYLLYLMSIPGDDENSFKILDPFDVNSRSGIVHYTIDGEGKAHVAEGWGTAYEVVQATDYARILNLRLDGIVDTYASLDDRNIALHTANSTVLKLLSAADASEGSRRKALLQGAENLARWIVENGDGELAPRINLWQARARLGELSDADRREIRITRRKQATDASGHVGDACLLILLNESEELDLTLQELDAADLEQLQAWPIWALSPGGPATPPARVDAPLPPGVTRLRLEAPRAG